MKKQVSKISLKTDKIVGLSKDQSQHVMGGVPPRSKVSKCYCPTDEKNTLTLLC